MCVDFMDDMMKRRIRKKIAQLKTTDQQVKLADTYV